MNVESVESTETAFSNFNSIIEVTELAFEIVEYNTH